MLRKCICMIVTVALVVCVSFAPVGAVDVSGSFSAIATISGGSFQLDFPRAGNRAPVRSLFHSSGPYDGTSWMNIDDIVFDISSFDVPVGGTVSCYISWAGAVTAPFTDEAFYCSHEVRYSLANTSSFVKTCDEETFNFSLGEVGFYPTLGVTTSFRLDNIDTLTALSINGLYGGVGGWFKDPKPTSFTSYWYIPSASLICTDSSATLDSLESIADEIAKGNDIAQAMYGDIMSALNALKDDTALMASYINDCLTYLNSIETASIGTYNLCAAYLHNLADIAQTAEDIEAELESFHTDFMSKLDLLISTITSESDDIQATMDRIYEQLIAWLETNFKEAISPEFEGSNSDLSQGIANNDAIEQEWTGSLSDTWTAMHIADFSFDPSFTSGFMWVSGWFSNIYNSLGLYGSIVILPLIIGICKLLLGYFRFAGHGHSKGGGDVDA